MAFTEFYCNASTGANINAGDNAQGATTTTNGAYTQGGGAGGQDRFVASSGTPFAGSSVGDFVSCYLDGVSPTTFIGRIVVKNSTTSLDISITAFSGTRPTTAGSGVSATVGGVWKGPNAASGFPLNFVTSALTNAAGNLPCINMKNNATYSITTGITCTSTNNFVTVCGYSSTVRDGGKATIDGGTSTIVLLTNSNAQSMEFQDLIVSNNGASGANDGVVISGGFSPVFRGCVANNIRGNGFTNNIAHTQFAECEAYTCNTSNTSGGGGFFDNGGAHYIRCISHDNTGSNAAGFTTNGFTSTSIMFAGCIADSNGGKGFDLASRLNTLIHCDAYNNTGDGFSQGNANESVYIESCNFVKNGGYGININVANMVGYIANCGFGAGTQANSSGQTNIPATSSVQVIGSVTYANDVTPWVDPANGDFRINLAAAINAGRGTFTQTAASYAGAIGYPDIGAAQHLESAAGGAQKAVILLGRGKP